MYGSSLLSQMNDAMGEPFNRKPTELKKNSSMDGLLQTQQRVQAMQSFLACRPWIPWVLPMAFGLLFHAATHVVNVLFSTGRLLPDSSETTVILCLVMAVLTVPLYRCVHVPAMLLGAVLLFVTVLVKHVGMRVVQTMHPLVATPLGVLDICCMFVLTHQWMAFVINPACSTRQLRRWVWNAVTLYIPLILVPQILLLVAFM